MESLALSREVKQTLPVMQNTALSSTKRSGQCGATRTEYQSWRPLAKSEGDKVVFYTVWREQELRSNSTSHTIYNQFHTLKGTPTGDPPRGFCRRLQRILTQHSVSKAKTSVNCVISRINPHKNEDECQPRYLQAKSKTE